MNLSESFFDFIQSHRDDECSRLRLKSFKNADFDTKFAIDQIEARRKTKNKLPLINSHIGFLYPSLIAAEQSTSEDVAVFKRNLFAGRYSSVCDLTGGLGIDTVFISDVVRNVTYIERYGEYCNIAEHNFAVLGKRNINVINADCRDFIAAIDSSFDAFYIDPARRGVSNSRLFSFADCEPDILSLLPSLLLHSPEVWIKASSMIDISLAISDLKNVQEVYAISVRNECKELLFHIVDGVSSEPVIHCVDLKDGKSVVFDFSISEEKGIADIEYADSPLSYLYEPDASILKGGAFKSVAKRYGLHKLHVNSHLYTNDSLIADFPGRKFVIKETLPFKNSVMKSFSATCPAANVSARNFPLSADSLRKRLKIKDGGDVYLFATKCNDDVNVLIVCSKVTA